MPALPGSADFVAEVGDDGGEDDAVDAVVWRLLHRKVIASGATELRGT